MKQEKLFKQVELKVREEKLIEKRYDIDKIPDGESTFTTSQETDIWEMISDGLDLAEILSIIRQCLNYILKITIHQT
jgi:hypothetical protein